MNTVRFDDFIRFATVKKGLTGGSINICKYKFNVLKRWHDQNNLSLSNSSVEQFIFELKQKNFLNNSINSYIFFLRYLNEYFKDRGIVNDFFRGIISLPKNQTNIIPLSAEEIDRLVSTHLSPARFGCRDTQYLENVYFSFTMFLALVGGRYDESARVTVSQLDIERGYITFLDTKNKFNRTVGLAPQLILQLKPLLQGKSNEDLVFVNTAGTKIHEQEYCPNLKRRAVSAGIKKYVHPHILRHSFATVLRENGVELEDIAKIIGHKDIQTTFATYVHLADTYLKNKMFMHPLIRKSVEPTEVLNYMREAILRFHLEKDPRFSNCLTQTENSIKFEAKFAD